MSISKNPPDNTSFVLRGVALTLLLVALCPAPVLAAVGPDQLDAIMGPDPIPPSKPPNMDSLWDHQAETQTRMLGKNDPSWNNTNPKWAVVYAKVRADIAADSQIITDTWWQGILDEKKNIADNLNSADVKSIQDYLKTDEGKRYQDFKSRGDVIMRKAASDVVSHRYSPAESQLPKEQQQNYAHMLAQTQEVQTQIAIAKTMAPGATAGDVIPIYLKSAIQGNQDDVKKLYDRYSGDVEKFEIFNRSNAQQHLFQAIALQTQKMMKKMREVQDAQMPLIKRRKEEWTALYQQQTGNAK